MGYLHAIPTDDKDKSDKSSRVESYGADHLACEMPNADGLVVNYFHGLGFNLNYGMGAFPLTWSEINSFSELKAESIGEWEADQLIMMSREYCSWSIKGKDKFCLSPWDHEDYDPIAANREKVAIQAKALRTARNSVNKKPL